MVRRAQGSRQSTIYSQLVAVKLCMWTAVLAIDGEPTPSSPILSSLTDGTATQHHIGSSGNHLNACEAKLDACEAKSEHLRLQIEFLRSQVDELTARLKATEHPTTGSTHQTAADDSGIAYTNTSPTRTPHRVLQDSSTAKSCTSDTLEISCTTTCETQPFGTMAPGNHATVRCPAQCEYEELGLLEGDVSSHVVGGGGDSGRYGASSPICLAAMHSTGDRSDGGQFIITIREPQEGFVGEDRDGLLSITDSSGAWRSFSVEADPCRGFIDICHSADITASSGRIGTGAGDTSAYYENDQNCGATIIAPRDTTIMLTFLRFDVESQNDRVRVLDGPNATHVLGPDPRGFSGFIIPDPVRSAGNQMRVEFQSDESVTWTGWEATWEFQRSFANADFDDLNIADSHSAPEHRSAVDAYVCPWSVVWSDDFTLRGSHRADAHSGASTFGLVLPFAFPFFQQVKPAGSRFIVACGGYLTFGNNNGTTSSLRPHNLPAQLLPDGLIAAFWTAPEHISECTIYTELSIDESEFFIEWHTTVNGHALTYQSVLSASGSIRVTWFEVNTTDLTHIVGVESHTGEAGVQVGSAAAPRKTISLSTNFTILSQRKPVSVSETCTLGADSTLAVDGNYQGYGGSMCVEICPTPVGFPWLQVDLLKPHFVATVHILMASGTRSLAVSVSSSPAFRAGIECTGIDHAQSNRPYLSRCDVIGRYVSVFTLSAHTHLSICEVDVVGDMHGTCDDAAIAPTEPQDFATELYRGCFVTNSDQLQMHGFHTSLGPTAQPESCDEVCVQNGHLYFGLDHQENCYCGNAYDKLDEAPISQCTYACPAASEMRCGGNNRMSLYETSLSTHEWNFAPAPPPPVPAGDCEEPFWRVNVTCSIDDEYSNLVIHAESECVQYSDNRWVRMCAPSSATCDIDEPLTRSVDCRHWHPFPERQSDRSWECSRAEANVTMEGLIRVAIDGNYVLTKDRDSEVFVRPDESHDWTKLNFSATAPKLEIDTFRGTNGAATGILDLTGPFKYAVNVGGKTLAVGNVQFSSGLSTEGVQIIADQNEQGFRQHTKTPFGSEQASAADAAFGRVLESAAWSAFPNGITLELSQLTKGTDYRLQLILAESCADCIRMFDIVVDGVREVTDFTPRTCGGPESSELDTQAGVVVVYEFTAAASTIQVELTPNADEKASYLGCYFDSPIRDMPHNKIQDNHDLTLNMCMENCARYAYMGLEWGADCYCGNEYGTVHEGWAFQSGRSVPFCTETIVGTGCAGDRTQTRCGGPWANSVYRLPLYASDSLRWIDPDLNHDPVLNALTLQELFTGTDLGFAQANVRMYTNRPQQVRVQTVRPARFEDKTAPHLSWTLPRSGRSSSRIVHNAAPPNDQCMDAIDLSSTDGIDFSTEYATVDGKSVESCQKDLANRPSPDIWFIYRPLHDQCHTISTCNPQTNFDTSVSPYEISGDLTAACEQLSTNSSISTPAIARLLDCGDDAFGCPHATSNVQLSLRRDSLYLIRIAGGVQRVGAGRLTIQDNCNTCIHEDLSQESAEALGDCHAGELHGKICGYWDVLCPIRAIIGQCSVARFASNRCPKSCEINECATSVRTDDADKGVLLAALDQLSAQNPMVWDSWINGTDPCRDHWAAVRCDHFAPRRVVAFYVERSALNSGFPLPLLGLSSLTIFGMIKVGLSGELPDALGQAFPGLKFFSVADNHLTGTLPSTIGQLPDLMYLDLRNNQLEGIFPSVVAWPSMQNFDASLNVLSGTMPDISEAAKLQRFHLNSNALSGTIPQWIGTCSHLQWLELQENSLSGTIPRGVANVTTLTKLHLHGNPLTGALPSLEDLTALATLRINNARLSGTFPQGGFIFRLGSLEVLDVGDNDLSGTLPKEIGRLRALKQLLADDNEIKGTIPATIGQLTHLQVLNLDRNFIHGVLPMSMIKITGLQRLQMAHNQLSGNEAATIGSVLSQMHSLTTLDMYFSNEKEDLDKTTVDPPLPLTCTVGKPCSMRVITRSRDGDRIAHGGLTMSVRRLVNATAAHPAIVAGSSIRATDHRDGTYSVDIPSNWIVKARPVNIELLSNDAVVRPAERRVICYLDDYAAQESEPGGTAGCSYHYDATTQGAIVQTAYSIGVENDGFTGGGYAVISELGDSVTWTLNGCDEADYTIFFRYSLADGDHTCVLSVDGMPVDDVVFPVTGTFATWRRRSVTTRLPAGTSTISLASMDLRSAPMHVDGMEVSSPNFAPGVLSERWFGVSSVQSHDRSQLDDFRDTEPTYPNRPTERIESTASMESPEGLSDYYFVRMRTLFWAHETGNYSFVVLGDDNVELYLGEMGLQYTESELDRIAWSDWRHNLASALFSPFQSPNPAEMWQDWDLYAPCGLYGVCPRSENVHLQADRMYYMEAVLIESYGNDGLVVGVRTPTRYMRPLRVSDENNVYLFNDPTFVEDAGCRYTKELKYEDSSIHVMPIQCNFDHARASPDGSRCNCDAGFQADDKTNVRQCQQCNAETYSLGGDVCRPCPATMEPNAERSGCQCKRGYFSLARHQSCVHCPLNSVCPGGPKGDAKIYPLYGNWISPAAERIANATDLSSHIYSCTPPEVCRGYDIEAGGCPNLGCCLDNHKGVMCGTCESDEFIKHRGLCISCPGISPWRVVLLIGFYTLVGLYLTIKTRRVKDATGSTAIITGFLQTVALYGKPMWNFTITRTSTSPTHLQGLGGTCSVPLTFYQDFVMRCFILPVFLLCCVYAFNHMFWFLESEGRSDKLSSKLSISAWYHSRAFLSPVSISPTDISGLHLVLEPEPEPGSDAEVLPSRSEWSRRRWQSAVYRVIQDILHRRQLQRGAVEVAAFCFMPASQRAMSMCFCRQVEDRYYLISDYSLTCDNGRFWAALSSAVMILALWTVGMPVIIIAQDSQCRKGDMDVRTSSNGNLTSKRFGVLARLQSIFHPEQRYWYSWLVIRRVLLAMIFLFGQLDLDLRWGSELQSTAGVEILERDQYTSAASWSTATFFVLTCSVLIQEWQKPFRFDVDNLLEQCTLIMLMTVLYIDIASPHGDFVSMLINGLVYLIMFVVTLRVIGPKYLRKAALVMKYLPCRKTQVSDMEEGLYTSVDELSEQQDNVLHVAWGAARRTTEG